MTSDQSRTSPSILNWASDPSNRETWTKFATRYRDMLIGWCLKNNLGRAEAEDMSQEISMKMQEKIRSFSPLAGRFRPWLKRVTLNACIDYLRRERPERFQQWDEDIHARKELDRSLETQSRIEMLQIGLARLQASVSERDFIIFIDLTYEGLPAKPLAKRFGITVSAVNMIKFRMLKKFSIIMLELDGDDHEGGVTHE